MNKGREYESSATDKVIQILRDIAEALKPKYNVAAVGSHHILGETLAYKIGNEILPRSNVASYDADQLLADLGKGKRPDLIVTDVSGLAQRVQEMYPGLKVRMVIGSEQPCESTPNVQFVGKPMDVGSLDSAIKKVLGS